MNELEKAQKALAMLLKELFLLPLRIDNPDVLEMFANIIIDQVEKSFNELNKLTKEDEVQ